MSIPGLIHLSVVAPTRRIRVRGKIHRFEWHPYCGPTILDASDSVARNQPDSVIRAICCWNQQGRRLRGDLAIWEPAKSFG